MIEMKVEDDMVKDDKLAERLRRLILEYEIRIGHLVDDMPHHEKWGAGAYKRHELALCEEFVGKLKTVEGGVNGKSQG